MTESYDSSNDRFLLYDIYVRHHLIKSVGILGMFTNIRRILYMVAICVICLSAQNPKQPAPTKTTPQQSSPAPQVSLPQFQLDDNSSLHHLNQVISWYRHSTTGIQSVGLPSDAIYQDNLKSLGAQAVQLAFQSAKAESALIKAQQKSVASRASSETTQAQNLAQMEAKTSAQIEQLQSQIQTLNAQLEKTSASKRV